MRGFGRRPREKGGELTGPNPVDRGKPGSKIHLLTDASGLPLVAGISTANTHDSQALAPLVRAVPAIRSRRGPRRRKPSTLHADKAYDLPELRRFLRSRDIGVRIARRGIDSGQRWGRHRWKIEHSIAGLGNYRRLARRWERKATHVLAFVALTCALICYRRLQKAIT